MTIYQPEKIRGMLLGMFIGDALAMPVHWYYDTKALQQDYGPICNMEAPKEFHPNSLLHLSNTGGH
ncbi:MAG: ADP-ribosylglycohydrolase family protein, partial [bacterium]